MALNFNNEEKLDMLETNFIVHRNSTATADIYETWNKK